jgi:hypothetical protein
MLPSSCPGAHGLVGSVLFSVDLPGSEDPSTSARSQPSQHPVPLLSPPSSAHLSSLGWVRNTLPGSAVALCHYHLNVHQDLLRSSVNVSNSKQESSFVIVEYAYFFHVCVCCLVMLCRELVPVISNGQQVSGWGCQSSGFFLPNVEQMQSRE